MDGEEEEKEKQWEEKKKEVAEEERKGSQEDRDYVFRLGIFQKAEVKLKVRLGGCFNVKEKYFSRWVSTNLWVFKKVDVRTKIHTFWKYISLN